MTFLLLGGHQLSPLLSMEKGGGRQPGRAAGSLMGRKHRVEGGRTQQVWATGADLGGHRGRMGEG